MNELRLFVWEGEGVLQDHGSGMICVLAHDLAEALKKIEEKYSYCMNSFPVNNYLIITEPEAFACYGSN